MGRRAYPECPLCGATERELAWRPSADTPDDGAGVWVRCVPCGHLFTPTYLDADGREALSWAHAPETVGHDLVAARSRLAPLVERVAARVGAGIWMDIGFGTGALLFTAAEYGFRPVGLDRCVDRVFMLQSLGVHAEVGDVSSAPLKNVEVISFLGSLERCVDPRRALGQARARLARAGVLLISTPNVGSWAWRLADLQGPHPEWTERDRFHLFSASVLQRAVERAGFIVADLGVSRVTRCGVDLIARPS